jgi:hypothetical protein
MSPFFPPFTKRALNTICSSRGGSQKYSQLGGAYAQNALITGPSADILPGIINMPRVDGFRRVAG